MTGRFCSSGTFLKCKSIAWAPARNSSKVLKPNCKAIGRPTADHTEYRPPTQSQKGKILDSSIPNCLAAEIFAVTANKEFAICPLVQSLSLSQLTTTLAFMVVSKVVNDFETMMTRVLLGWARSKIRDSSAVSMLAKKCIRMPRLSIPGTCARASIARRGPRSDPPMPMWITSVTPTHLLHSASMRRHTSAMAGMTSVPSSITGDLERLRSAEWRAGRSSLRLICLPANISVMKPSSLDLRANENNLSHCAALIFW